jgi:hypothetical protein
MLRGCVCVSEGGWMLNGVAGGPHLCKVGRRAQAGKLLCRVDAEWPAVAFGPDGRLAVGGGDAGEEVEAAVAEYKVPLCLYCEILLCSTLSYAAP